MSTKTRRLTRAWRPGGYPPALHNARVAQRKRYRRLHLAVKRLQRTFGALHATFSRMHAASAETAAAVSKLANSVNPIATAPDLSE